MEFKNMLIKAKDLFKGIIQKATVKAPDQKELRLRDQKAILTKALNRYVKNSMSPLKIAGVVNDGIQEVTYSAIIIPQSFIAVTSFMRAEGKWLVTQHLSFSWLSNYIVVHGGFDTFLEQIPKVTVERKVTNEPDVSSLV